jgi:hypothetical protein
VINKSIIIFIIVIFSLGCFGDDKVIHSLSHFLSRRSIKNSLENASKRMEPPLVILTRSINPSAFKLLYEGAYAKDMSVRGKSSNYYKHPIDLRGLIPLNQFYGKVGALYFKLKKELENTENIQRKEKLSKKLKKLKNKIGRYNKGLNEGIGRYYSTADFKVNKSNIYIDKDYQLIISKEKMPLPILKVIAKESPDGFVNFVTSDIDVFSIAEKNYIPKYNTTFKYGEVTRINNYNWEKGKFVGVITERTEPLIEILNQEFVKQGFYQYQRLVNHGFESAVGFSSDLGSYTKNNSSDFPMHGVDHMGNYKLIKNFDELKVFFQQAWRNNYFLEPPPVLDFTNALELPLQFKLDDR